MRRGSSGSGAASFGGSGDGRRHPAGGAMQAAATAHDRAGCDRRSAAGGRDQEGQRQRGGAGPVRQVAARRSGDGGSGGGASTGRAERAGSPPARLEAGTEAAADCLTARHQARSMPTENPLPVGLADRPEREGRPDSCRAAKGRESGSSARAGWAAGAVAAGPGRLAGRGGGERGGGEGHRPAVCEPAQQPRPGGRRGQKGWRQGQGSRWAGGARRPIGQGSRTR